jgi:EpsD family peptidyl-prolyl cis-trans isomerase
VANFRYWALLPIALLVLAACSRHEPSVPTRVAAKVNGTEISVPHFQLLFARVAAQMAEKPNPAVLMDGLIDRELLAQKAVELKLDRDVPVALALADAKADILAQAYLENHVGWSSEDQSAVTAFYDEHPALFEQRRIYRVFELAVIAPADSVAALKERARRARGLHEVAAWLKNQNLPFEAGGVTKASEQLAPHLLSRLASMEDGQIEVLEVPGGASVLQLLQSDGAPLSRDAAAPTIERLLRLRKRAEASERERKYLRSKASIEYVVDLGRPRPPAQGQPLQSAEITPTLFP